MKRVFFLLLFAFFVLPVFAEECISCQQVASLTPTRLILVPDEVNYFLKIMLYNVSKPSNPVPMPNAVIIIHRYNATDRFFEKVYTDKDGVAIYNFSNYKDECYNYQIMFCSCNDSRVRECCLKVNNIDITKSDTPFTISGIKDAPNLVYTPISSEIIYDYHSFPATSNYAYCKPKTAVSTTPAFCLPLAIIFALLGGSLALTGRNPLRGFEIGGARVGKHIRYDSRGRYAGYQLMSLASTFGAISGAVTDAKMVTEKGGVVTAAKAKARTLAKQKVESVKEGYSQVKKGIEGVRERGLGVFNPIDTAPRVFMAVASIPLTIAAGLQRPFYWIPTGQTGAGSPRQLKEQPKERKKPDAGAQEGIQLPSIGKGDEERVLNSLYNLCNKLGFKAGADLLKSYGAFLVKLSSYSSIEVTRAQIEVEMRSKEVKDLKNQISDLQNKMSTEGKTKDGVSYVATIDSTPEMEFNGKKVKVIGQMQGGSYVYLEDGKQKIISKDEKNFNRFEETLHEAKKDTNVVGAVIITTSSGRYIVTNESGNIVIRDADNLDKKYMVTTEGGNIVIRGADNLDKRYMVTTEGGNIVVRDADKPTGQPFSSDTATAKVISRISRIYGMYTDVSEKKPDFAIGSKNENLPKMEEIREDLNHAIGKFQNAVNQLQQYEWVARNDLLSSISKGVIDATNKQLHSDPQNIVKIDTAVLGQILVGTMDEKTYKKAAEEYTQALSAAEEYAQTLSTSYAAEKLGVSEEKLRQSMEAAGYKNDVKGYLNYIISEYTRDKEGYAAAELAKSGLKPIDVARRAEGYYNEIITTENKYKEQISKIETILNEKIANLEKEINENPENKGYREQLSSLSTVLSYIEKREKDPYNPAAALSELPSFTLEGVLSSLPKGQLEAINGFVKLKEGLKDFDNTIYYNTDGTPRTPEEIKAQHDRVGNIINGMVAGMAVTYDSVKSNNEKEKMEDVITIINWGNNTLKIAKEEPTIGPEEKKQRIKEKENETLEISQPETDQPETEGGEEKKEWRPPSDDLA